MKSFKIGIVFGLLASMLSFSTALAAEDHTPAVCAEQTNLCFHLGFHDKAVVGEAAKFMLHFLVDPTVGAEIRDVNVELWMDMGNGHGHGSSPVDLRQLDAVHYMVSNAYFVMEGEWTIKVSFTHNGKAYDLSVPYAVQ